MCDEREGERELGQHRSLPGQVLRSELGRAERSRDVDSTCWSLGTAHMQCSTHNLPTHTSAQSPDQQAASSRKRQPHAFSVKCEYVMINGGSDTYTHTHTHTHTHREREMTIELVRIARSIALVLEAILVEYTRISRSMDCEASMVWQKPTIEKIEERERERGRERERANLFFKMGVRRGNRSLIGGVIFVIPITFTIACSKKKHNFTTRHTHTSTNQDTT